jgi:hypothetical protein
MRLCKLILFGMFKHSKNIYSPTRVNQTVSEKKRNDLRHYAGSKEHSYPEFNTHHLPTHVHRTRSEKNRNGRAAISVAAGPPLPALLENSYITLTDVSPSPAGASTENDAPPPPSAAGSPTSGTAVAPKYTLTAARSNGLGKPATCRRTRSPPLALARLGLARRMEGRASATATAKAARESSGAYTSDALDEPTAQE